jgi:hypothetical protein
MADRPLLTRREFMRLALVLTGSAVATSCAPLRYATSPDTRVGYEPDKSQGELTPINPSPELNVQIKLGEEKSADIQGIPWVPDTRTSYITNDNGIELYFSGDHKGYSVKGRSLTDLDTPEICVQPSFVAGEYGVNCYRAPTTVFDDKYGNRWSLEHLEEWQTHESGNNFTSRIALRQSTDGGKTWTDHGVIIDGQGVKPAGERVTGAGQGAGIIRNVDGVDFLYVYYTDWSDKGPDQIHLARAPLSGLSNPDSWQKYYNGDFVSSGRGGLSTPVITRPNGETYAAQAGVSWNTKLNKYLTTFETGKGFWVATSFDGLTWESPQQIAYSPQEHDKRTEWVNWFSYPTLISLATGNQFVTDDNGALVYSKGSFSQTPTEMKFREFTI